MNRVILIDLSHLFWSAWHATADMGLSEAYTRTIESVARYASGHQHVAVCCDAPPYWRHEKYSQYKANRVAQPPQAIEQLRRTKDRLIADGYLLWDCKGFEADDLIATATQHALAEGHDVLIVTGDKDLCQLICDADGDMAPCVRVRNTRNGEVADCAQVIEKFGVKPEQIRDLLALTGDSSDNIPGIPKVGPKTAAGLLREWGDIDAILRNADKLPPKLASAIVEHGETLRLSRELASLRTDAPIEWAQIYERREPKPLTEPEYEEVPEEHEEESDMDAEFEDEKQLEPQREVPKAEQPSQVSEGAPPKGTEVATKPAEIQALARVEPASWSLALEPTSFKSAWTVATMMFNSRLYQQYQSAEAICSVIMRGRELGLGASTSLATFHVVEGRPTMSADLIRGLVLSSGKCEYFDLVESSSERATWETKRRGARHETKITWTIEDAVAAGLLQRVNGELRGVSRSGKPSNWDKYRRTMLRHRAGAELARAVYPDITAGLYTPEEISDGEVVATFD